MLSMRAGNPRSAEAKRRSFKAILLLHSWRLARLLQQSCNEALHDEMHAQKYCCMEDNSLHKPEHRKQTKGANIYNNNGTHIEPGNLRHKA